MTPPGGLEVGGRYVQWNPACWSPLPGRDAEVLPKFLPGCLDHQLGAVVTISAPGGRHVIGQAMITGYRCADDGSGIWMRYQVVSLEAPGNAGTPATGCAE
jgi:hypothetical protein